MPRCTIECTIRLRSRLKNCGYGSVKILREIPLNFKGIITQKIWQYHIWSRIDTRISESVNISRMEYLGLLSLFLENLRKTDWSQNRRIGNILRSHSQIALSYNHRMYQCIRASDHQWNLDCRTWVPIRSDLSYLEWPLYQYPLVAWLRVKWSSKRGRKRDCVITQSLSDGS
jgi:hypothetical protein